METPARRSEPVGTHAGFLTTRHWMLILLLATSLVLLTVEATPSVATVYRAWPSGACRAVVTSEGIPVGWAGLPPLHHVVWVSPHWNGEPAATRAALARTAADDTRRGRVVLPGAALGEGSRHLSAVGRHQGA